MRTVSSNHELINGVIDDHQDQTTGLLFDDEGKTIGAWMLIHYAEPGFYLVTETSMRGDWVPETVVNPRQLIFDLEGDEIDEWEGKEVAVFAVGESGLDDLTAGRTKTKDEIAAAINSLKPHQPVIIDDRGECFLMMLSEQGHWLSVECGPDARVDEEEGDDRYIDWISDSFNALPETVGYTLSGSFG